MPRKKISATGMPKDEYEKKFGRKKPGPAPGFKRKKAGKAKLAKSTHSKPGPKKVSAAPGLKKDGTPKKKPGPQPGFKRKTTPITAGAGLSRPEVGKLDLEGLKALTNELNPKDLRGLKDHIQERLESSINTNDFDQADWEAVETMVHSKGYEREDAILNVRETKDEEKRTEKVDITENVKVADEAEVTVAEEETEGEEITV